MKQFVAISILCLAFNFDLQGQSVFRNIIDVFYGGIPAQDRITPMTLTHDSAVVFCQYVQDSSAVALGIFKINYSGNLEWSKFYSHPSNEQYNDIVELPDGSFVLAGNKDLWTDFFFLKIDSVGNLISYKTIGEIDSTQTHLANCFSTCITSDGNLAFTGKMQNYGFLAKTDYSGNVIWLKNYYKSMQDAYGQNLITTNDGGLLVTGHMREVDTIVPGINFYMFALKTDVHGNLEWFKQIKDSVIAPVFGDVLQTSTDEYLIAAYASYPVYRPSLFKLSSTGEIKWYKVYNGQIPFAGIEELPDGNYMFCSQKSNNKGPVLSVIDTAGNLIPYFNIQSSTYNSIKFEHTGVPPLEHYCNSFLLNERKEAVIYNTGKLAGLYKPIIIRTDSLFNTDCYTQGLNIADSSLTSLSIDTTVTMINKSAQTQDLTNLVTYYNLNPSIVDFCLLLPVSEIPFNKYTIDVFPNPFTSLLSVSINNLNKNSNSAKSMHVTIRNIYNQIVYDIFQDIDGTSYFKTIELNNLSHGIYLIEIDLDKDRIVRKVLKQ